MAQPGRDLARGEGWVTALVYFRLQGAVGLDATQEADSNGDRRGLHFDARALEYAIGLMRRHSRHGQEKQDGDGDCPENGYSSPTPTGITVLIAFTNSGGSSQ